MKLKNIMAMAIEVVADVVMIVVVTAAIVPGLAVVRIVTVVPVSLGGEPLVAGQTPSTPCQVCPG